MGAINLWGTQVNKVNVILNVHVSDKGVKTELLRAWTGKEEWDHGWGMDILVSYGTISEDDVICQPRLLGFSSD